MIAPGIFRQYDIRGIYGRDLTVEAAEAIGRAYPAILAEHGLHGAVAVGRDNRPSGAALRDALVRGLTASGADVIDLGEVPTPLLYWSLHHLPVVGGIQITGSHNPPEYNGFKCCVGTGSLHGEGIQRLRTLIEQAAFPVGAGTVRSADVIGDYVTDIAARIGPLPASLKVVIDCGNGAGAIVAPRLFQALGATVTWLYETSDGTFPNHHPDPTVEANLVDLIRTVRTTGSALGIGFDGDADRIGLVDETGDRRLGGSPAAAVRPRRPRPHGEGASDHLRREVLADARGRDRRGRWDPRDVEDGTLPHQGQDEGPRRTARRRDVGPHVLRRGILWAR